MLKQLNTSHAEELTRSSAFIFLFSLRKTDGYVIMKMGTSICTIRLKHDHTSCGMGGNNGKTANWENYFEGSAQGHFSATDYA